MNLSELMEKIIFGHPCSIANASRLMTKKVIIWTLPTGFDPPRAKIKIAFLLSHDCLDLCLFETHDHYTSNCKIDCSFENFKCVCASQEYQEHKTYALNFDNTR